MNDIVKAHNVPSVMAELYITYDPRKQGHIFYIEICGTRFEVLQLWDFSNQEIDIRLAWLIAQTTPVLQFDPTDKDPRRFMRPWWVRCVITPAIMLVLGELQHYANTRPNPF